MDSHSHKQASELSGGNKRKLCSAIALLNKPELVFMDEASNGVDPISRKNLYTYLKTLKTTSTLIITHRIDEAEKICDKIAIMNYGEFIDFDDPIGLKDKYGTVFILQVEPMVHTAVSLDQIDAKITRTFDFCQRIYSSQNDDYFEMRPSLTYRFDNIQSIK